MNRKSRERKSEQKRGKNPRRKNIPQIIAPSEEISETLRTWPEWIVTEDYSILKGVTKVQELPINLEKITRAGRTPNWDLAADMVNLHSNYHRNSRMCKHRYASIIMPREQGKIFNELSYYRRLKRKDKSLTYNFSGLPKKLLSAANTPALVRMENNCHMIKMWKLRLRAIRNIIKNRPTRKLLKLKKRRASNHAEFIKASGIDYDNPKTPVQLAPEPEMVYLNNKEYQALYKTVMFKLDDKNKARLDEMLDKFEASTMKETQPRAYAAEINPSKRRGAATVKKVPAPVAAPVDTPVEAPVDAPVDLPQVDLSLFLDEESTYELPELKGNGFIGTLNLADGNECWSKMVDDVIKNFI